MVPFFLFFWELSLKHNFPLRWEIISQCTSSLSAPVRPSRWFLLSFIHIRCKRRRSSLDLVSDKFLIFIQQPKTSKSVADPASLKFASLGTLSSSPHSASSRLIFHPSSWKSDSLQICPVSQKVGGRARLEVERRVASNPPHLLSFSRAKVNRNLPRERGR